METRAGEFGAVASQGHDDGPVSATVARRRPNSDELALLGILNAAGTEENVIDIPPEAHLDATDPWGGGDGAWRVESACEAEGARTDAHVEHLDVDRIVSRTAATPNVSPLLAVPLHECEVLTHPRRLRTPHDPDRPDTGSGVDVGRHHGQHAPRHPPGVRLLPRQYPPHHAPQKSLEPEPRPHGLSPCVHAPAIPGARGRQARSRRGCAAHCPECAPCVRLHSHAYSRIHRPSASTVFSGAVLKHSRMPGAASLRTLTSRSNRRVFSGIIRTPPPIIAKPNVCS